MSWPWPEDGLPVVARAAEAAHDAPNLALPRLSPRLAMAAYLARTEAGLADIGTDHAHLPVAMVRAGWASRAVAVDCAQGPLVGARRWVAESGLDDRVAVRLGVGLAPLDPGDADTAVVAGLGGQSVITILASDRLDHLNIRRVVVQPNRDDVAVRAHLAKIGWRLDAETLVFDGGRIFYTLAAERGGMAWSSLDVWLGPYLRRRHDRLARAFRTIRGRYLNRRPAPSPVVAEVLRHIAELDGG